MEVSRRDFLKLAGIASVGAVAATSAGSLLTGCSPLNEVTDPNLVGKTWSMMFVPSNCEEGCDECIKACNQKHNIPDLSNKKHEIKWIWNAGGQEAIDSGTEFEHAFPEYRENEALAQRMKGLPFLVLCNHCANPPCVRVCPTKATFRRDDGIVMMDYHRCIGCRFCVAACPYGARSFNFEDSWKGKRDQVPNPNFPTRTKGVVEKCNFSQAFIEQQLRDNPDVAPMTYCMQACVKKKGSVAASAIIFGDLGDTTSKFANSDETPGGMLTKLQAQGKIPLRRREIAGTHPKVYYLV